MAAWHSTGQGTSHTGLVPRAALWWCDVGMLLLGDRSPRDWGHRGLSFPCHTRTSCRVLSRPHPAQTRDGDFARGCVTAVSPLRDGTCRWVTERTPSSQHSHGQGQELPPCKNIPLHPFPLANTPRASLPPCKFLMDAQRVPPLLRHLSWEGTAALRRGARRGDLLRCGPGKARCWLPPSCCAAEMRRKTTRGASPHLPSSPRAVAPPALSSPSASGSFISRPEVRIAPLSRQPPCHRPLAPASALGPTLLGPNGW